MHYAQVAVDHIISCGNFRGATASMKLLTPQDVADCIRVSISKVYALAKSRKLRYLKIGEGKKSTVSFGGRRRLISKWMCQ